MLQLYDLSSEDITDWRALVDYVALLLTDRTTTTPAVALMMRVEVSAPLAFAATLLPCYPASSPTTLLPCSYPYYPAPPCQS